MKISPKFVVSLCMAFTVGTARAELTWERHQTVVTAEPGAGKVVAHFPFQNIGKRPVTIGNVATSCGCTGTTLAKKTLAPGEKGELLAAYFAGERKGIYGVEIEVETDDGSPAMKLHLRAVVADVAQIKPTLAFWKGGESLAAKRLVLTMREKTAAQTVTATSSNPQMAMHVEQASDSGSYALVVTPRGRGVNAVLMITVTLPDGKMRVLKAFAKS